jgi:undecaprenyl-diphosphatase
MWESLVEIDRDIFRFINGLWIGKFESFWLFVTQIENWFPLYLLFFFLLYKYVKRPVNFMAMGFIPVVAITTLSLTNLVKNYVERLRPNNEPMLMDSIQILQKPENFSFWSGHSAVSFAVTLFVVLALRKTNSSTWLYLLFLWPVTFAFSRIFVGVHYPADVTMGMLVGLILGYIFHKILSLIEVRLQHAAQG